MSEAVRIQGLNEIVKDLRKFGHKDTVKIITTVNRKFAIEIREKTRRKLANSPVPLAKKSSKGVTHRASVTKASLVYNRQKLDKYPTINMANFGARNWHVPNTLDQQKKFGQSVYPIRQSTIGRLPHSRPGAKRTARKWVGSVWDIGDVDWTSWGKDDYGFFTTIKQTRSKILDAYSKELDHALDQIRGANG